MPLTPEQEAKVRAKLAADKAAYLENKGKKPPRTVDLVTCNICGSTRGPWRKIAGAYVDEGCASRLPPDEIKRRLKALR